MFSSSYVGAPVHPWVGACQSGVVLEVVGGLLED